MPNEQTFALTHITELSYFTKQVKELFAETKPTISKPVSEIEVMSKEIVKLTEIVKMVEMRLGNQNNANFETQMSTTRSADERVDHQDAFS